jgi:hypothetical protein
VYVGKEVGSLVGGSMINTLDIAASLFKSWPDESVEREKARRVCTPFIALRLAERVYVFCAVADCSIDLLGRGENS